MTPHDPRPVVTEPGVLPLAEQAADAIRELNHLTRHADAITNPPELARLLAELAVLAGRLPQLLDQLDRWLRHQHDTAQLRADTGDPAAHVSLAATRLTHARGCAHQLADTIDTAHQHVAHLATA